MPKTTTIRIVSDGTLKGTKITDGDGRLIDNVLGVSWKCSWQEDILPVMVLHLMMPPDARLDAYGELATELLVVTHKPDESEGG